MFLLHTLQLLKSAICKLQPQLPNPRAHISISCSLGRQDDDNKAVDCTEDTVGKVQYITKDEKFQACVPSGNTFQWTAISSGDDDGPCV